MNPQTAQKLYLHVFRERLGLEPEVVDDGIVVTVSTLKMFLDMSVCREMPQYLHLVAVFPKPNNLDETTLLGIVNAVNRRQRVARAELHDTTVIIGTEQILSPSGTLPSVEHLVAVLPDLDNTKSSIPCRGASGRDRGGAGHVPHTVPSGSGIAAAGRRPGCGAHLCYS